MAKARQLKLGEQTLFTALLAWLEPDWSRSFRADSALAPRATRREPSESR